MKKLAFFLLTASLITACSSDDLSQDVTPAHAVNQLASSSVSVSNEGYLVFPTIQSLQNFVEQYSEDNTKASAYHKVLPNTRATGGGHFESVADLSERLANGRHKTRANSEVSIDRKDNSIFYENIEGLDELEEMTEDEYNVMKAENLLFDDIMTHMVDTTLRVCVEGRLYKITDQGTFSIDVKKEKLLDESIRTFNPELKLKVNPGASVALDENVTFTRTFSDKSIQYSEFEAVDEPITATLTRAASNDTYTENAFHVGYNTNSYLWKNHSVVQKFFDWLRGKDVSRENYFSKKHRVQMEVFDVNYGFYASAGIKVNMQKRKKFLGIPYWKGEKASKIVIGFNGLDGVMKYNNPRNYSTINPTMNTNWNTFTGAINNIQSNFFYGNYHKLKFIKDWTDDIICLIPEIKIGNTDWREKIGNKLYEAPAKAVYSQLKSLENKYIYSPVKKRITSTDPMMAYLVWGNTNIEFNKEHPYITGVKEYTNCKSKSVIFDRSFGFSFSNVGGVSGFLPSEFDIKKLDVFGAAYYDRQWRGVRFYKY